MPAHPPRRPGQRDRLVLAGLVTIVGLVILRSAWVTDDAYITFRVVDNLLSGYGPRWNAAERVQVFTHPLWFWLLSAGAALHADLWALAIGLGVAFSVAAAALVLGRATDPGKRFVLAAALIGSAGFVDFATSGLENALAYALIALFVIAASRFEGATREWLGLALLAGLVLLTRVDLAPLLAPTLIVALVKRRPRPVDGIAIAAGALPFAAWEAFSLVYYGAFVPNTAIAKVSHGLPASRMVYQGVGYIVDAAIHDPITPLAIGGAILCGLLRSDWRARALAVGLLLQLAYVADVGGDFMRSRFLAAPFVGALALLAVHLPPLRKTTSTAVAAAIVALSAASSAPFLPRPTLSTITGSGIADERAAYAGYTGLLGRPDDRRPADHPWWRSGAQAREQDVRTVARCSTGMFGYAAGPSVYVVDPLALSEPFLARLPARENARVGHYERAFPAGYLRSRALDENALTDPELHALFDDVTLVTRGALLSGPRWRAILRLNSGRYRHVAAEADFDRNATGAGITDRPDRGLLGCMGLSGSNPQIELRR